MFEHDIDALKDKGLLRRITDRSSLKGVYNTAARIVIDRKEYLNFSSNDYLGLAASPLLAAAAKQSLDNYPFGAGASRLLSGGTDLHAELERRIAAFKSAQSALLFNSGYHANMSIIPAIAGERDIIFSDELNHASIIDGCRLSRAKKMIYHHKDMEHLSWLLHKEEADRKIVITDTVFSMDGDIAPLNELIALCRPMERILLYLDDAHGTGVLGAGRGALAHFDLKPEPWILQMGTFSKALGSFGAFVAADRDITDWLTNTARGLIYSTALPSCIAAASLAAIDEIESNARLIDKLWHNQRRAVFGISELGLELVSEDTPILAISAGDIKETLSFAARLNERGIYAPAIRPPTVKTPRIRVTISAAHSDEDIDALIEALNCLTDN